MRVSDVTSAPRGPLLRPSRPVASPEASGDSFSAMLKQSLEQVNALQGKADTLIAKVAAGDLQAVHEAMLALGQAGLAFDLTVQVRNKLIEAYQELMRTQT